MLLLAGKSAEELGEVWVAEGEFEASRASLSMETGKTMLGKRRHW